MVTLTTLKAHNTIKTRVIDFEADLSYGLSMRLIATPEILKAMIIFKNQDKRNDNMDDTFQKPDITIETDVCVIGGAASGLTAAISAAENGAKKVTLIEKTRRLGGTLGVCFGLFGVESTSQKRLGIQHTADECFSDLIKLLYWSCDARLVRNWMRESGDSIRWLESKGLFFDVVVPFQGLKEFCRSTYHVCSQSTSRTGMQMLRALKAECEKLRIEIFLETRAQHLIQDSGKVSGVMASQSGRTLRINAKSTIIATGSISANKELISRFYQGDDYKDFQIMSGIPHNTGDGLIMAEAIGAKIGNLSTLYIGPHNHGPGHSELTGMFIRRPQSLKINRNGERFIDEGVWTNSDFGWMVSYAVDRQPGKMIWVIFDQKMIKDMTDKNEFIGNFEYMSAKDAGYHQKNPLQPVETDNFEGDEKFAFYHQKKHRGVWLENLLDEIESEKSAGRVKICQTVEEIAAWTGADVLTLKDTFTRYNTYCHNGYDADFLKRPCHLIPLETPPYYVFQGPSGIDTCIGGINVNHGLEVVDRNQKAIPGLYAAGVCTSGWLSGGYGFYGSELSFAVFSGRTAGANAAKIYR
jgi:fumarate reductase flavoprotein subunit